TSTNSSLENQTQLSSNDLLKVPTYLRPRSSSITSACSIQDLVLPSEAREGIYQMFSSIDLGKTCEYEIVVSDEDLNPEPEVICKFRVKGVRAACQGLNFTVVRFEFGE